MAPLRTSDVVSLALLGGVALLGLVLWPRLPPEMAVHFDATSTPDNYVDRPVGILLAPVIGTAAIGLVRAAPRFDTGTTDPRVLDLSVLFLGGVIAYVQGFVLAWNLGYRLHVTVVVVPVLALAGLLVVYTMRREGYFA